MPAIGGILFFLCANSYAIGPVDGEIGIAWWATDFESDFAGANIDAGSTTSGFYLGGGFHW
jgi:hypothetical protein